MARLTRIHSKWHFKLPWTPRQWCAGQLQEDTQTNETNPYDPILLTAMLALR